MMRLLLVFLIALCYTGYHYWAPGSQYADPSVAGQSAAGDEFRQPATDNAEANNAQVSKAKVSQPEVAEHAQQTISSDGAERIRHAFATQATEFQVEASGTVLKLLDDDQRPPRHQRFVVKLGNGITLLVAHNIDLAARVADLKPGDTLRFYGEYAWNKKGGVVHWTHHDPQGKHVAGWLRHNGRIYQ